MGKHAPMLGFDGPADPGGGRAQAASAPSRRQVLRATLAFGGIAVP